MVRAVPRPRRRLRVATVALVAALLAALAGCDGEDRGEDGGATEPEVVSPLAECDALAAPPAAGAGAEPALLGGDAAPRRRCPLRGDAAPSGRILLLGVGGCWWGPVATGLPDLALPVLHPAASRSTLAELRGPAVVNLSGRPWCHPCRQELPVFQRFAEKTAGRVWTRALAARAGRAPGGGRLRFSAADWHTFPVLMHLHAQLPAQLGGGGADPATRWVRRQMPRVRLCLPPATSPWGARRGHPSPTRGHANTSGWVP